MCSSRSVFRRILFSAIAVFTLLAKQVAPAAVLELDPSVDFGTGADSTIQCTARGSDGSIWLGGSFSTFNGVSRAGLVKLQSSGAVDTTFAPSSSLYGIQCVHPLPDGKVMVGVSSVTSGANTRNGIARLNADGSLDASFNANPSVNGLIYAIESSANGGFVVAGSNGRVAKITSTGAADPSFSTPVNGSGTIHTIKALPSGKILIGGSFSSYQGVSKPNLAMLNSDGTVDASFNPSGSGPSSTIHSIAVQTDGKLLLGGSLYSYNGVTTPYLVRISADGLPDMAFKPNVGSTVYSLAVLPDGRILAGGSFTTVASTPCQRVVVIRADGKPDTGYDSSSGFSNDVNSLLLLPGNKFIAGGSFTTMKGTTARRVAALQAPPAGPAAIGSITPNSGLPGTVIQVSGSNLTSLTSVKFAGQIPATFTVLSDTSATITVPAGATSGVLTLTSSAGNTASAAAFYLYPGYAGQVDPTFLPGTGPDGTVYGVAKDANGRLLACGSFSNVNGVQRPRIARLNTDGTIDPTFQPSNTSSTIQAIAIQPDGRILASSSGFSDGSKGICRYNTDGSVDSSFSAAAAFVSGSMNIYSIAIQTDGKIVIGGSFTRNIARLNADGSVDPTFNSGSGTNGTVRTVEIQPDGKILIGGSFSSYNGTSTGNLTRLQPNGSLDTFFKIPGSGISSTVYDIELQESGDILVAGSFYSINGNSKLQYLARLKSDGTPDTGFMPMVSAALSSVSVGPDGRIAIGGDFLSVGGQSRNYAALLNADGSPVSDFNTTGGPSGSVSLVLPMADGGMILAGGFESVGGQPPARIARLQGDGGLAPPSVACLSATSGSPGNQITIFGSLLAGVTSVKFSGDVAASFTPVSQSRMTVTVPAGAMSGPITVTTAQGQGVSGEIFRFSNSPAPVISNIPSSPVEIGSTFVVTGANFYDVSSVRVGVLAAAFTVNSATQMTVTVPAGATRAKVIATGPGGTAQSTADLQVVGAKPVLTHAATASGIVGKGFSFTLGATNTPQSFSAAPLPPGLTLNSSTGVISGVPSADGATTVTTAATNAAGTTTGSLQISISLPPAPTVASVSPPQVPAGGKILVSGNHLYLTTGVTVGGVNASFQVISDTVLSVTMPEGVTSGTITVTTPLGSATSNGTVSLWAYVSGGKTVTGHGDNTAGQATIPPEVDDVIAISAGPYHTLALKADGSVTGWGANWVGQAVPPVAMAPAVAISAGGFHSLSLSSDGSVSAWGRNDESQCSGMNSLSNVASVSAGGFHSLALLRTGAVKAAGLNTSGQTSVPADLGGVVAISAGFDFSVALKADGTAVCWGNNSYGQCQPPAEATNLVAISAGNSHVIGLKADGSLVAWGAGWSQQTTIPSGLGPVARISAGSHHTLALLADGTVAAWGANWSGQTNVPSGSGDAVAVAAGGDSSIILRSTAPLPALSVPIQANGTPNTAFSLSPATENGPLAFSAEGLPAGLSVNPDTGAITGTPTKGSDSLVTLVARNSKGVTRRDFRIFTGPYILAWGTGTFPSPTSVSTANTIVRTAMGRTHGLALLANGTVIGWGSNLYGALSIPAGLNNVVQIGAGDSYSMALRSDGAVFAWGMTPYGNYPTPTVPIATGVVALEAKARLAVGITSTSRPIVLASYDSSYPMTGTGTVIAAATGESSSSSSLDRYFTIDRGGLLSGTYTSSSAFPGNGLFDQVTVSNANTFFSSSLPNIWALKRDGTVTEYVIPTFDPGFAVATGITGGTEIKAGDYFALALKSDRSVSLIQATPNPDYPYNYPSIPFAGPESDTLVDVNSISANGTAAVVVKSPVPAPRITSQRVIEGRTGSVFIHQLTATGSPTQYSATFLPSGLSINASTGRISGTPTVWGTFSALVIARTSTDFTTQVLSIKLTQGVPPVDLTLTGDTVLENRPTGTVVGTFSTLDYTPSDSFTYALAAGTGSTDNGKFSITGNQLLTRSILNFEALSSASVRVQVTDSGGNTFQKVFLITITDATDDDDDKDGLTQAEEAQLGTNPALMDTDQDGAADGLEVRRGTNPMDASNKPDNYVAAWGQNTNNQCVVPPDLGPVASVVAGSHHTLALLKDGTVAAWGSNGSGQCDVPENLHGVVALAAGYYHSLALKSDGTLVAWGGTSYNLDQIPAGLSNVIEIGASDYNSFALTESGQVVVWGSTYEDVATPPGGLSDIVKIVAGDSHVFALRRSGGWVAWGLANFGIINSVNQIRDVHDFGIGDSLVLGITDEGHIQAWGSTTYGANSVPSLQHPAIMASAGYYSGMVLGQDGSVTAWGYNGYGQSTVPPGLGRATAIASGEYHSVAVVDSAGPGRFLTSSIDVISGAPFQRQLSFSGPADGFSAMFIPPGVSFDPLTATLSGIISGSGTSNIRFTAMVGNRQVTRVIPIHSITPRGFGDWILAHPAGSSLLADTDGDSMVSLLEYALMRDPAKSETAPATRQSITALGGQSYLTLSYDRLKDATDIRFIVEVSPDMGTWSSGPEATANVSIIANGDMETVTVRDVQPLGTGTRRFIRLRVEHTGED